MKHLFTLTLCFLTLSLTAQQTCPNVFDFDNDGNVAVNDFLAMLGYFGDTDSDSDGVWDSEDDCLDLAACNYSSNPTEPCYSLDALEICGGWCEADDDGDGICDFACGQPFYDDFGYSIYTVEIGDQCWFRNDYVKYDFVNLCDGLQASCEVEGNECYQGNDAEIPFYFGQKMYNGYAVIADDFCPSGWHIPSHGDWTELINFVGGPSQAGYHLKSTSSWYSVEENGNGSNSSGFNGQGNGYHSDCWGLSNFSEIGIWWSSSSSENNGHLYALHLYSPNYVGMGNEAHILSVGQNWGAAVRCLKD